MSFPPPLNSAAVRPPYTISDTQNALLRSVFSWMTGGLLLTALVSSYLMSNLELMQQLLSPGKILALCVVEFGLVFWLSTRVMSMSAGTASAIFLAYSALNGITLTPLLLYYSSASVSSAFFTTAAMFGGVSAYGAITKRDLSSWGTFLMMGLWGMIVAGIINIFVHSPVVDFTMSVVGVIVFTGLTAYDVNAIKSRSGGLTEGSPDFRRMAVCGALSLYINFINLFISLLRLMGDRRD